MLHSSDVPTSPVLNAGLRGPGKLIKESDVQARYAFASRRDGDFDTIKVPASASFDESEHITDSDEAGDVSFESSKTNKGAYD